MRIESHLEPRLADLRMIIRCFYQERQGLCKYILVLQQFQPLIWEIY